MNMLEMGMTLRPRAARLELCNSHPIARELAGLLVAVRPLRYQSMPRFEAILHGPDHLNLPLISRLATRKPPPLTSTTHRATTERLACGSPLDRAEQKRPERH